MAVAWTFFTELVPPVSNINCFRQGAKNCYVEVSKCQNLLGACPQAVIGK